MQFTELYFVPSSGGKCMTAHIQQCWYHSVDNKSCVSDGDIFLHGSSERNQVKTLNNSHYATCLTNFIASGMNRLGFIRSIEFVFACFKRLQNILPENYNKYPHI
jgi:hypothetical protein